MGLKIHAKINILRHLVLMMMVYTIIIQPFVDVFSINQDDYKISNFVDEEKSEKKENQEEDVKKEKEKIKFTEIIYHFCFQNKKIIMKHEQNLVWDFNLEIHIQPPEQA